MKSERNAVIVKTSIFGIVANILLSGFKAVIGWFSHSIAITLDAVNNLTDAVSSIITMIAAHISGKDPDKKHPFGHGRTEYIATMAIGTIIAYAGFSAGIESIKNIIHPKTPEYKNVMFIVLGVAVAVKVFLALFFINRGKKVNSDSLTASGKDAFSDVLISVGTIVAAVVYMIFHISLEAYLGILISIFIVKAGVEILIETISKILGEGTDVELVKKIKKTIVEHEGVMGAYDLVFNNYGQDIYVGSVHIEVVDTMTANEIDMLTRHITKDILEEYNIFLSAIGIYAHTTTNQEVIKLREDVSHIAVEHEYVNQVHGFYADTKSKEMRFDMVISFDAPSRAELYEHVIGDLKKKYPDYEISASMDSDFNEI
nr:cation diffusion facilitator family transporter [uncultured Treponema sp.]